VGADEIDERTTCLGQSALGGARQARAVAIRRGQMNTVRRGREPGDVRASPNPAGAFERKDRRSFAEGHAVARDAERARRRRRKATEPL